MIRKSDGIYSLTMKIGKFKYPLGNTEAGAVNFNLEFKLPPIHIR